jgi:magnesium-transporting ATPase (P-type)
MGEADVTSSNGAHHANSSSASDSTALASPDDQPPIAEPPDLTIEKPSLPHSLSPQRLAEQLRTDVHHGLSSEDAAARLARDGPNSIKGAKGPSLWQIFLAQVANALTVVLIAVAALSFAIQDYIEAGVVVAVIVLNIVVGYVITTHQKCSQGMPRTRNPFPVTLLLMPRTCAQSTSSLNWSGAPGPRKARREEPGEKTTLIKLLT